ncbi:response regulator transcription factor [Sulfurovum sp. ST-21]|uniref:Helix-turn-helix transcriptional regulator n=1 Tax=Sulfurovum indicum TaxID=2779528 RepID=A0A7M1S600_9BACT|nr:helix-turn-helix transcriptional regulator [Sulfurovum indicum]QOR62853.1 helix-turn-helix transcriptional regulator [Sulfurovum indicum]
MEEKENTIQSKIIEFQSCIIQGRDINAMLHKDRDFYLKRTQADIISLFLREQNNVKIGYVIEAHHRYKHLLKEYVFDKNSFSWNDFIKNCKNHFTSNMKYAHTSSLYELFKGLISKKNAIELSKKAQLKDIITMPIYDFDNKTEIAFICFMFQNKVEIKIPKLKEVKELFETLTRPLHDEHYGIFYTKCRRIDEELKLLTAQEKRIVRKVLSGKSYTEIAEILNLSINTVKTHMKSIFRKYQVNSKIELYNKLNSY